MNKDSVKVLMHTSKGKLTLFLYPETPLHQQNFIRLVESKFYEGVLFHRVIKDFMAQAGDPNSKDSLYNGSLGSTSEGDTISAEFVARYHHKKGALSAARTGDNMNPTKASSGSQFYIVQGRKFSTAKLNKWLSIKTAQHPPPMLKGKRLKLRYITQIKTRPPNFLIFSSSLDIPKNYRKFLINGLRDQFDLKNVPIRLGFRVGDNPYVQN